MRRCGSESCILTNRKVCCAYFVHERRVMFENNVSELVVTVQDAMICVFYVFTRVKKGSPWLDGENQEFADLRNAEMEKVHLELSVAKGCKQARSLQPVLEASIEGNSVVKKGWEVDSSIEFLGNYIRTSLRRLGNKEVKRRGMWKIVGKVTKLTENWK